MSGMSSPIPKTICIATRLLERSFYRYHFPIIQPNLPELSVSLTSRFWNYGNQDWAGLVGMRQKEWDGQTDTRHHSAAQKQLFLPPSFILLPSFLPLFFSPFAPLCPLFGCFWSRALSWPFNSNGHKIRGIIQLDVAVVRFCARCWCMANWACIFRNIQKMDTVKQMEMGQRNNYWPIKLKKYFGQNLSDIGGQKRGRREGKPYNSCLLLSGLKCYSGV